MYEYNINKPVECSCYHWCRLHGYLCKQCIMEPGTMNSKKIILKSEI